MALFNVSKPALLQMDSISSLDSIMVKPSAPWSTIPPFVSSLHYPFSFGGQSVHLTFKMHFYMVFLSEEVYMCQPNGFVDSQFPDHVCKLQRSLYDLKQAHRAWFRCFSSHLEDLGFTPSQADTYLFIYLNGSIRIYLLIYVDDILVTWNDMSHIARLIVDLGRRFAMKDLGPAHYFLDMEIVRTSDGLFLSQQKYVHDLLLRTKMAAAKPVRTPAVSGRRLSLQDGDPLPDPT
ncbi:hypothetical protein ACFX15_045069 [Malus domestica]